MFAADIRQVLPIFTAGISPVWMRLYIVCGVTDIIEAYSLIL